MKAAMNTLITRLATQRLLAKTRRRGSHKGGRAANRLGSSLEFSDFRLYQPGDDIRQIDWNVYGRTHKHYIKRFLDEQELSVTIFLDCSESMQVLDSKWQRAKELAACFSYITLTSDDRLSFIPVTVDGQQKVSRKGAVSSRPVFFEILKLAKQSSSGTFIENLSKHSIKNSQLTILITDGLEPAASFDSLFRSLGARKQEVRLIQLLSLEEMAPSYSGDVNLIDSETNENVNISLNDSILAKYQNRLKEHNRLLESLCRRYGFTYLFTTDQADLNQFLFHECKVKQVLY